MKKEEITLKNTKSEILEALNAALEREKILASTKYEPAKEEEKKKLEKAIEESKENVEQKIFSEELNNKFKSLEIAIKSEEEKLKELYGIENELNNLVIAINAGKDYMAELEDNKRIRTDELNSSIKTLEEKYAIKVKELEQEYKDKAEKLKLERDREEEEYEYKKKREREISNNKWEDEKKQRENKLAEKENETNKLLEDTKANVEHIQELEDRVNEIPKLMENEYERGRTEMASELEKENKYATELLKKEYESTIDRQSDKIESLQEEVKKINLEKEALQKKLDGAYIQIKEMATKTVEAAGGVKIIGNNGNDANK